MPTLDWLNRADAFTTSARVPYRLLQEVSVHTATPANPAQPDPTPAQAELIPVRPELVEGSPASTSSARTARTEITDNLLIQGDNLEALKALLPFYRGQVKCIFIDPPYNTKSAFEHYDDNLEHAQWLSMMLPRLQLLRELLREDGSIWVTIDDNEGHYLKVLMDEVFGRGNFVANVVWQKKSSPQSNATGLSDSHDHVLCYARNRPMWMPNLLERTDKQNSIYKHCDEFDGTDQAGTWYGRGPWFPGDFTLSLASGQRGAQFAKTGVSANLYPITAPSGRVVWPAKGRAWAYTQESFQRLLAEKRVTFGKAGDNKPCIKRFLSEFGDKGVVPMTTWHYSEVGENRIAMQENKALFADGAFATPKPEALLYRILHIGSTPNDLILDSFLGSGTTAAVAHKMGRRWIGIEMGEHAATHCLPRLQKVIDGEQGGISKAVGWTGGGGFRFMRLGATVFDEAGRIHPAVRFATLAAFVWQQETGVAFDPQAAKPGTPYLGTHYVFDSCLRTFDEGQEAISYIKRPQFACYLLFNGILKDKRPASGNVLTLAVLDALLALHATTPEPSAPLLVYGEACRLGEERLKQARVTFKHIPYDVRAR